MPWVRCGVGGVYAIDIGIDIATIGLQGCGERHRRRIRSAAPERGYAVVRPETLETGDDSDLPLAHAADDLGAFDLHDASGAMGTVGADRNLPALPGAGIDAHRLQRDGEQT